MEQFKVEKNEWPDQQSQADLPDSKNTKSCEGSSDFPYSMIHDDTPDRLEQKLCLEQPLNRSSVTHGLPFVLKKESDSHALAHSDQFTEHNDVQNIDLEESCVIVIKPECNVYDRSQEGCTATAKYVLETQPPIKEEFHPTERRDINVPVAITENEHELPSIQINSDTNDTNISDLISSKEQSSELVKSDCEDNCEDRPSVTQESSRVTRKVYTCQTCHAEFKNHSGLTRHRRKHTGERPFACPTCSKTFSRSYQLIVHLRMHTGERPYVCPTCNKGFTTSTSLKIHIRTHTGERPFVCPTCNEGFITSNYLKTHLKTHVKKEIRTHTEKRPHVCTTCKKRFISSTELTNHLQSHKGEGPIVCPTCNKRFFHSHQLKFHMRIHIDVKPFECPTCKQSFIKSRSLHKHICTQTLDRVREHPFQCLTCNRRFKQLVDLKMHSCLHTGGPFDCPTCKKECHSFNSLKKHQSVHFGNKPYVCSICNTGFLRPDQLKNHRQLHTGE